MRVVIILAIAALPLSACDIVQQAAENQVRAEVSERVDAAQNSLRNSTDLDERYGNITNEIAQGENAVRRRADREINERAGAAANSLSGREQ